MGMGVQMEVANGKNQVDWQKKGNNRWMDDERFDINMKKKKKEREKMQHKLHTSWERGDCRKCEDISQGEHKRKKYAEGIFRTRRQKTD